MAHRSERVEFRASPAQKCRWRAAATALGYTEVSDFHRDAADAMASAVPIEPRVTPDPRKKSSRK